MCVCVCVREVFQETAFLTKNTLFPVYTEFTEFRYLY